MAPALPHGVSALLDPDDEPYLRILLGCALLRGRLGLPAWSFDELVALLDGESPPVPPRTNVVPFRRPVPRERR
ncbi:MAG TPA: hypothetical protein VMD91_07485 [Candidatus Sulfotelmatobacter sp.]|nr:hypothetical protein [Candidatus Sulfotelmatobacter sp.]